jgi:hypothetical protein
LRSTLQPVFLRKELLIAFAIVLVLVIAGGISAVLSGSPKQATHPPRAAHAAHRHAAHRQRLS